MTRRMYCGLLIVLIASMLGCGSEKADVPNEKVTPPTEKPTFLTNMPGDAKK